MRDEKETNTGSPKSGDGYGDGDSILVSERAQVAIRSESAIESYGPKFGVNLNGGGAGRRGWYDTCLVVRDY